jgi:hypothetical protein
LQFRIDFLLSSGVGSRACPSCFILLLSFTFFEGGCGSHHSHPGKKSTALSYINLSVYHQNYEYYSKSLQTPQITTCGITRVQSVPYLPSQQRRRTPPTLALSAPAQHIRHNNTRAAISTLSLVPAP